MDGTPARVETLRRRSQGSGVINTAYVERLNATFRERLAALTRRGRALARCTRTLQEGMYLIGTVYNFCTPQASLTHAGATTTPAMATGITDQCWSVHELLSYDASSVSSGGAAESALKTSHRPRKKGAESMFNPRLMQIHSMEGEA